MNIYSNITRLVLLLFSSQILYAKISVNYPAGDPGYKSVERLEAYGCAKTTLRVFAPLTKFEMNGALFSDDEKECQAPDSLRIEREVLKLPTIPGEAKVVFHSLSDSFSPSENLRGHESKEGMNLFGEVFLGSEGGKEWGFAGSVRPGFLSSLDADHHFFGKFFIYEGYLKIGYRQTELLYGRIQPEIGNTQHGGLFLTGDSKPLDMIKLAVRPHNVGGLLGFLGPISLETWVAGLGESSQRSNSRLWATGFSLRPFTFFEMGWLHAVQFGGAGSPTFDLSDAFKTFFYSSDVNLNSKRRESSLFHFGIWGPEHYVKGYTQLFFNQPGKVSGWFADDMGVLVGLWLPKIGESEFRLEYVHTPFGLYDHSLWINGWTNEGSLLGHRIGSDAEALYLDLGLPAIETWRPTLNFTYESRRRAGLGGFPTEWRYGGGAKVLKRWEKMEIGIQLRGQSVYNYHFSPDDMRNLVDIYTELRYFLL